MTETAKKRKPRKPNTFPKREPQIKGGKSIACSPKSHLIVEMLAQAADIPRNRMLDKIIEEYAASKLAQSFT
jgi:hypothetical protein